MSTGMITNDEYEPYDDESDMGEHASWRACCP